MNASELTQVATEALEAKKGEHIAVYDVRDKSEVTDTYVIVSGGSPPQLKAMANEVLRAVKDRCGLGCYRKAGDPESGWMVLDYVDVIIHIFLEETRRYYAIETLWEHRPETSAPQC